MLTDAQCRTAQPGPKRKKLSDGQGLYLIIQPSGAKSWAWKYRIGGREKKLGLGSYPLFSLKQARDLRDEARRKLAEGIDPGAEKQQRKRRAAIGETFEEIARSWHAMKKKALTPRYGEQVLDRLVANIFPQFGSMPIGDVKPPDVLAALRRIEKRGSLTMAREVRGHVSDVFRWAISSGLAEQDPAGLIGKALAPATSNHRPAALKIDQARKFLAAIETVKLAHWSTRLASRLLALTAARPGMVRLAERREFEELEGNEPIWRVPAAKMKNSLARKADANYDFIVPLSRQSVELVKVAIAAGGASPWLFPAENGKPMSDSTLSKVYRDAGLTGQHVPHGWRASFSTIMNERAAAEDRPGDRIVIDLMLAHVQSGVEMAYNRAAYMGRRREIAQEWADLLLQGAPPADSFRTGKRRTGS